ncbi:MAG: chloride channel protein, partial [Gemmatimonadales bacterium]
KLAATVLTVSFGGSVGKEGPAAQIGASLTSLFADVLGLKDEDRRRLVICGISAGFAAIFGTPISGALFGVEVLYLGRIDYTVLFPAMVAGILGHIVCGVKAPFPALGPESRALGQYQMIALSLGAGALFGLVALLLIETMRGMERGLRRFERSPYLLAAAGGVALVALYALAGDAYSGLGVDTITAVLAGTASVAAGAFVLKVVATSVTLETGGSGGIITPVFFIGVTSGAAIGRLLHLPGPLLPAFGFVALMAAAANTPIAAAVMAIELLPEPVGVYAALAAATAFLMVGHRSVYASQKLGISKSAGLEFELDRPIGDLNRAGLHVRTGTFAARVLGSTRPPRKKDEE